MDQRPGGWDANVGAGFCKVATLLPPWRCHGWVETTYKNVFGRKHPCPITVANKENHVASFGTMQCNKLYCLDFRRRIGVQNMGLRRERVEALSLVQNKCHGARRAPQNGCSMVLRTFLRRSCQNLAFFLTVFAPFEGLPGVFCSWTKRPKLSTTLRPRLSRCGGLPFQCYGPIYSDLS